jgi:hypothetical protein
MRLSGARTLVGSSLSTNVSSTNFPSNSCWKSSMGSEPNCSMSVGHPKRSTRSSVGRSSASSDAAFTSVVKQRHRHHGTCCRVWCGSAPRWRSPEDAAPRERRARTRVSPEAADVILPVCASPVYASAVLVSM